MSDTLKEEGLTLFRRGLQDEALAKFEAAAASYAAEGNDTGRGEMLNNIGVIQRVKRNYPAAIAALTQAQELFARIGDTNRQAQALGNLGDLYATQGEHVEHPLALVEHVDELVTRCHHHRVAAVDDQVRGGDVLTQ